MVASVNVSYLNFSYLIFISPWHCDTAAIDDGLVVIRLAQYWVHVYNGDADVVSITKVHCNKLRPNVW